MNLLLDRWPVYTLFIIFVIFNITIETMDTGMTDPNNNSLRTIQLVVNIIIIILILIYFIITRSFFLKMKSGKNNIHYTESTINYKPVLKKLDSKMME